MRVLKTIIAVLLVLSFQNFCWAEADKYTVMTRIQKTVRIIEKQKQTGELKPVEIIPLMREVQKNFKAGNLKKANKLLDEVHRRLSESANGELEAAVEYQVDGHYEKIMVADSPPIKNGIADPSLEYGDDGIGWMAYSHVDFKRHFVSTYLAKSDDNGKTWKHAQIINQGGDTNKETSTIVHDPDDPGREWKLFYFEYIHTPKGNRLDYSNSWISYKYASNPEGPWSGGIPVLGPPKNRNKGIDLVSLHPDLKDFVFFNELGSIYKNGAIYLSMEGAASPTGAKKREKKKNILLASKDHGKTWEYVGILTDNKDANDAGYLIFTASSLVEERGRVFLFVSPSGKLSNPLDPEGHHDGTHIFEFKDITKAELKRDNNGKLILLKHIDDNLEKGGQADYDEQNTYGGIVIPQQDLKYAPEVFQLFSTKEKIVE